MHWRKQSWLVSVMQGHSTRSDQAVANNLQTSANISPPPPSGLVTVQMHHLLYHSSLCALLNFFIHRLPVHQEIIKQTTLQENLKQPKYQENLKHTKYQENLKQTKYQENLKQTKQRRHHHLNHQNPPPQKTKSAN